MATGWSTSDLAGGFTVSGTGNVAVTTTNYGAIRSATSHASGKWYFEATFTGAVNADLTFGIASGNWALSNGWPGLGTPSDSVGLAEFNQQEIYKDNATVGANTPGSAMALGATVSVCVDVDNKTIYFLTPDYISLYGANAWNGSPTANPASNIGGISFSSLTTSAIFIATGDNGTVNGTVVTLNTGGSAFARSPPSGFSAWDNWGTQQAGSALTFGAGGLTAKAALRAKATPEAFDAAGSFSVTPSGKQLASATFAGVGSLFATRAQAQLVSAVTTTSADTATASLAGQVAQLVAGSTTSGDQGVGFLIVPSILAATQQLQNALIDTIFRGQPLLAPTTWYVALVTQLGSPTVPGFEVSASGYARASIPASLAAWSGTQAPGTTDPSSGTTDTISNNINILFPSPTADWGTVIGYELWDAPSGGNRWISGKLASPLTINNGGAARQFAAGALTVSLG